MSFLRSDDTLRVSEHAHGTLGTADVSAARIAHEKGRRGPSGARTRTRTKRGHDALVRAIRGDTPYNEAVYGAESTMTVI